MYDKSDQPLASVGIPTYDRENGLTRLLHSITRQTCSNIEIIISNDCSPEEEIEGIVHKSMNRTSAITDAANSFNHRERLEHNNFNTTARIAAACVQTHVPLLHMSSTSVYGTQKAVVDEDCSEEELQPQSPYAETKLKEEQLQRKLGHDSDLHFVTCRCGTIVGTSPGMRFHTAVNKFCWQAVMGSPLPYGEQPSIKRGRTSL